MTVEQNLIAALKEAITEIRKHDTDVEYACYTIGDELIEKWLGTLITCRTCDGYGSVAINSWGTRNPPVGCLACNGTGKRPLREVI